MISKILRWSIEQQKQHRNHKAAFQICMHFALQNVTAIINSAVCRRISFIVIMYSIEWAIKLTNEWTNQQQANKQSTETGERRKQTFYNEEKLLLTRFAQALYALYRFFFAFPHRWAEKYCDRVKVNVLKEELEIKHLWAMFYKKVFVAAIKAFGLYFKLLYVCVHWYAHTIEYSELRVWPCIIGHGNGAAIWVFSCLRRKDKEDYKKKRAASERRNSCVCVCAFFQFISFEHVAKPHTDSLPFCVMLKSLSGFPIEI